MSGLRVGIGFDAHALEEGVPLVLGGVAIDHPRGLAGHSDGDVIAHALIDAIHVCALFNTIDRIADALGFEVPSDDYFRSRAGPFLEQGYALPP